MTREVESAIFCELKDEDNRVVNMLDEANDTVLDQIIGIDEETGEVDPLVEPLF